MRALIAKRTEKGDPLSDGVKRFCKAFGLFGGVINVKTDWAEALDLSLVPNESREDVRKAFQDENLRSLNAALGPEGRQQWPGLVFSNREILARAGLYESHLLHALVFSCSTPKYDQRVIEEMIDYADRERLLNAGDPLPPMETYTLYRGCSGTPEQRRVRGFFWTSRETTARRFAWFWHLPNPVVYQIQVKADAILVYDNLWNQDEYLVRVPQRVTPILVEDGE